MKTKIIVFLCIITLTGCRSNGQMLMPRDVLTGAERMEAYLPLLKNNKVGIVANHTSMVGDIHLVDTLLKRDVEILRIFSPEHGFRGQAGAGEHVKDDVDQITGLPIVSLYGSHRKPTEEDLKGIDMMVFDMQDVGARFYTYISTMTYVMDACAEFDVPLIVLDRPNPNGFYVDGPVLEPEFTSFVGMHPVPVVYGMTIGEYALMVNGERWLDDGRHCTLKVIKLEHYDHNTLYDLPVKPSPNLPNMKSVYLYPSLCFFEGTIVSVGRGTEYPFQIIGHPDYHLGSYTFTPQSMPGAALHPKHEGKSCNGHNLQAAASDIPEARKLNLRWLIAMYKALSVDHPFFNNYFDKLAGTDKLRKQIKSGLSESEIRKSWQKDLKEFKEIRKQYLLYADFE
ncbi:MAG: DUF1343 domain-containing protein [Bacteroidales bacterium]|nr:DUF1343 domain-containing protein [Bacteroidales bacterium]